MENLQHFKLITGEFDPADASTVLLSVINTKINFHNLESFGNQIRNSGDPGYSERRIMSLSAAAESVKSLMAHAAANGKRVRIESLVNIEMI